MTLTATDLLIIALATWRLSYFITSEIGPFGVAAWVRKVAPLGGLTTCLKCASFWTALACFLLWLTPLQPLVWVLAAAGAALMLASYSGVSHT